MRGGSIVPCTKQKLELGQFTCYSDLQICIMNGIVQANKDQTKEQEKALNLDEISINYKTWLDQKPSFNCEEISNCFSAFTDEPKAWQAKKAAIVNNSQYQTNSSLARIVPLAVWTSSLRSIQDVKRAVVSEVELTHSSMLVHAACFLYCASLKYLLNHPDDPNRAQRAFD